MLPKEFVTLRAKFLSLMTRPHLAALIRRWICPCRGLLLIQKQLTDKGSRGKASVALRAEKNANCLRATHRWKRVAHGPAEYATNAYRTM